MNSAQVAKIVGSDMTVSDKIRALASAGYPRAEIARLLDKRYQHVRNVLEADRLHPPRSKAAEQGPRVTVEEPAAAFQHDGAASEGPARLGGETPEVEPRGGGFRLVVREDGSVVLPREVCDAFGISGRGVVMARLDGDEFKLISAQTALRRVQEMLRPYMQDGVSWVDELIAERRRETEREA
jgi:hypothetical protein